MQNFERTPIRLEQEGTFSIGCNYWASHAGTGMWRRWRPEVVRADFTRLAGHGIEIVRVFPLWPDFQPISMLYTGGGQEKEVRFGEEPLPTEGPGREGVSVEMLGRFGELCEMAKECGIGLVVGLVTGWMSGRLFVPPALVGRDPITDPQSLMWQMRMVRAVVRSAAHQPAVVAWDLGNECNCMGRPSGREAAYVWSASIANTIRVADPSRPIVSGMHSLGSAIGRPDGKPNPWLIEDQADVTDVLTTHPYPYWTRHTRADRVDSLRTTLHATAETRLYADLGGKPCFAEEIGTMGPMVASDKASADFARVNLFSLWANDCRGFMWWCAHDQTELAEAPYDWVGVELELGLLRNDGSAKPVLLEMSRFRRMLAGLPFARLPRRRRDAVCVLSHGQDDWAAAYGSYVLGKQAKIELDFCDIEQAIPESPVYLLPCLTGVTSVPRRKWLELLGRVRAGATLYVSLNDGVVPNFNEACGVEVVSRCTAVAPAQIRLADGEVLSMVCRECIRVENRTAEVLGVHEGDGSPAFWRVALGAGHVVVLAAPLELAVTTTPGSFDLGGPGYWKVYQQLRAVGEDRRFVQNNNPHIALTEHVMDSGRILAVAINHTAERQVLECRFAAETLSTAAYYGSLGEVTSWTLRGEISPFDAVVFEVAVAG